MPAGLDRWVFRLPLSGSVCCWSLSGTGFLGAVGSGPVESGGPSLFAPFLKVERDLGHMETPGSPRFNARIP